MKIKKEIKWETSQGNEIKIMIIATAKIVKEEIKADGQETGIIKEWLYQDTESRVYLDGVDLGPAEYKPVNHPVIHAALNDKIALTKERYDQIQAAEKAAIDEAKEADEVKKYLEKKEVETNKAIKEEKDYRAHVKSVQNAMTLDGDTY